MGDDGFYQHEFYDDFEREEHVVGEYRELRRDEERIAAAKTRMAMIARYRASHSEVGWWVSDAVVAALAEIAAVGCRPEVLP